jgi:hypothetical protein
MVRRPLWPRHRVPRGGRHRQDQERLFSTSRANYAAQLVCERLTGAVEPSYTNAAMQWGTDKEPEARDAYAFENVVAVEAGGFHRSPAHYALWRVS